MMKLGWILVLAINLFFLPLVSAKAKWYENGTLHKSSANEWESAESGNKLATAMDWTIAIPKIQSLVIKSGDMNNLKPLANELVNFIDTELESNTVRDSSATLAVPCMSLLGWL